MNLSIIAKSILSHPLCWFLQARAHVRSSKTILILMYHRVLDIDSSNGLIQEGMYVRKKTFRKHVEYLKKHYDVVSLETCLERINGRYAPGRQICSITFDDGWKDFYDNAFPILMENNLCATVFLPTGLIGTNEVFWTDKLGKIIVALKDNNSIRKIRDPREPLIEALCDLSGSLMSRYEKAIGMLKDLPFTRMNEVIDILYGELGLTQDVNERSFLTWEEIRSMKGSGWVHFGSHTKNHVILTNVDEETIREELMQSKERLIEEKAISEAFIPFSYPNGNYTDRIADMVRGAGYNMALTTNRGVNRYRDDGVGVYELKRIGIHQDVSSIDSMFSCRINGIF